MSSYRAAPLCRNPRPRQALARSATAVKAMQAQGWDIGCLYNHETDEHPQLCFSHQLKTGNSLTLAREIRRGLDPMNLKFE